MLGELQFAFLLPANYREYMFAVVREDDLKRWHPIPFYGMTDSFND